MDGSWFVNLSPFLIIIMSAVTFLGTLYIYRKNRDGLLLSLSVIPFSMFLLYLWIGFGHPLIEDARTGIRSELIFFLSIAIHVIYCKIISKRDGG